MNTKTSENDEVECHPLLQPLFDQICELAEVIGNVDDAWNDEQKENFYEQSLKKYTDEYVLFYKESKDIINTLEQAELMAKDLKKPFAGMVEKTIFGGYGVSLLDIHTVARREFSKIFNRDGWGS